MPLRTGIHSIPRKRNTIHSVPPLLRHCQQLKKTIWAKKEIFSVAPDFMTYSCMNIFSQMLTVQTGVPTISVPLWVPSEMGLG
jgi:hypothetical protein